MNDRIYHRVAKVLDTLPPGFPSTESGVEIKILKRIFRPDEAELFCNLRMTFEAATEISRRTSIPLEGLEDKLDVMFSRGQIRRINIGEEKRFCLVPWASGLYELQLNNMDKELAAWVAEYGPHVGLPTLTFKPQIWQSLPIEKEIPSNQIVLPHQQVSVIIENGSEFWARECICKKVRGLNGKPCSKPVQVCLAIDRFPHIMGEKNITSGRKISKEEAYALLDLCEAEGLVHMTHNTEGEHNVICNCCGCCCGAIRGAKIVGAQTVFNTFYFAEIDQDLCDTCGICKEERCQLDAIEEMEGLFQVDREKCIGCGLCVSACPAGAVHLIAKKPEEIVKPLKDRASVWEERARQRGVDYSAYR